MWLPNVERVHGNSAGSMNGDGSRKLLLHSTEGSSIAGAIGAYRANNSWPHLTVDCPEREIVEHLDLLVAARSLRNDPGGADQTNRDGSVHVQVELVGLAERPASIGDVDDLAWLGANVVRPVCALTGIPVVSTVRWAPYPASYGKAASQRLSVAAWDAYSGVLGHQHAPDNSHGDPGAIDIARILAAARGTTTEDDMTPEQMQDVLDGNARRINGITSWERLIELTYLYSKKAAGDDVDEAQIAALVRQGLAEDIVEGVVARLPEGASTVDVAAVKAAVADELATRLAS